MVKEKTTVHCQCCGGFTLHKEGDWWVHKKCAKELSVRLHLLKTELPLIRQQIVFGSRKCLEASVLSIGQMPEKWKVIQADVEKKALEIFHAKYGLPSWIRQTVVRKEMK